LSWTLTSWRKGRHSWQWPDHQVSTGRPRVPDRACLTGILFVLRSRHRPDCVSGDRGYDAEAIRQGLRARHITPLLASEPLNTAADWGNGGGWWIGLSPGLISFCDCVFAMKNGPTS
jgi:hypothetical protein